MLADYLFGHGIRRVFAATTGKLGHILGFSSAFSTDFAVGLIMDQLGYTSEAR